MGSLNALMRSGAVSHKTAGKWQVPSKIKGTSSQPSKMANFDHSQRDEASKDSHGAVPIDHKGGHINAAQFQRDKARSMPSKGGAVNAKYVPGRRAINQFPEGQHKTFPKGASYEGGPSAKTGNTRMKGPIPRSGGYYGGGGQNTQ